MRRPICRFRRAAAVALVLFLLPVSCLLFPARASAQLPPDAEWRTFDTEHFRVTFQPSVEPSARRAAERAERAYALLARELVDPPEGRIELLVADNVDLANGYASPIPRNRIVLYAHPPADNPSLAFYNDWLELLVTHELVHIFHLDHAGGVYRPLRSLLGRNPVTFPSTVAPGWVTEGLATYYESRLTGAGRVLGTLHEMTLRAAVLENAFFSIDRATGTPVTWPGGGTPYIYGSLFLEHLAATRGPEVLPEFVRIYGRQLIPFRLQRAARRATGVSFNRAWERWTDSLRARYGALADSLRAAGLTEVELLTEEGRTAAYPRYSPDGAVIAYGAATGRDEPALRLIAADGQVRTLRERTTLGPAAWLPEPAGGGLLYAQLQFTDPYHLLADLYRADLAGSERRLTQGARVWEPDVHPDGRLAVVVSNADGTNVLELIELDGGTRTRLTEPSLDVHWSLPRWSPDGQRIAAARWSAGGQWDIVLLDMEGRTLRRLTDDRAVDAAPAWSPDGRYVLFGSDRTGIPNLFAYDLREDRLLQVTRVLTGAFTPDVSPDGRWIALSLYRADGYHIARMPYDPAGWWPAPPADALVRGRAGDPAALDRTAGGAARPYSPLPTLAPTSWMPALASGNALGVGAGASVNGQDVIERHLYGASALVYLDGGRVDAGVGYRYRGLGMPLLDAAAAQEWVVSAQAVRLSDGSVLPSALLRRDRSLEAGALWLHRRWRSSSWLGASAELTERSFSLDDASLAPPTLRFRDQPEELGTELRAGYSSVRGYGFSIGPQEGVLLDAELDAVRLVGGETEADGLLRLTSRGRAYRGLALPGFARHVLALRADAGAETNADGRIPSLQLGGASGGASPFAISLGALERGLRFPLRGYDEGVQRGSRVASLSAEYRVPLALVERGLGTLPVFLDRLWADAFLDAGAAWCPGAACRRDVGWTPDTPEPLLSVGAELLVELDVGFFADLTLRGGAALPLSEVRIGELDRRPDAQVYLRVGRSF